MQHGESTRLLALTFGLGRHLLREDVIEEGFGLRTVLNSVIRTSLRSIDKTTLGSVPKQSREQMGRESDAGNFGIDIEQDLVNAVTGRSTDLKLGKTISGKDSLSVSVKVDINNVGPFLKECLDSFVSDKYKTDFGWIDQIKAIKDPTTISMLDAWLVKSLSERSLDRIWMAPPTVLDWVDVKGFRYGGKVRPKIHADLDARTFLNESKDKTVTVATLKSKSVYAISSKTDDILDSWSAYKCFYAEYKDDSHVYILNNGRWYKVAEGFTQEVISDFDAIPESTLELPPYKHGDEGHYNSSLESAEVGWACMDRKLVSHGGGHNAIEFCDLLTSDKRIVHVKRYGGAAQFSHLFNQGVVSGELFVQEAKFRERLNEKLPESHRLSDPNIRPNASEYEIVFAIISKSENPLEPDRKRS